MSRISQRAAGLSESITLKVSSQAAAMRKAGIDVVGFGAGEPDFDTPGFIKDAAKAEIDRGQTKYTPSPALPELRKAIADKFRSDNGLDYRPEQISVGAGGKHCLYAAFQAVLDPGDEVILPSPYWVSYPEQIRLTGARVVIVEGSESNGFKITPQQLEAAITPRTKGFIINSPSNPTGHAYTPEELKALAEVVARHERIITFSDEIYEKLTYHGLRFVSFATLHPALPDRTLTFNCHSKSFAMTGWRVGYVGGPPDIIAAINRLISQQTSHITSFCQMPAALALTDRRGGESIESMRREFEKRALHMWKRLCELPLVTCVRPQGAFYCFPNVSRHYGKSLGSVPIDGAVRFAAALLEHSHVAVVPGTDSGSDAHVRLSFATSMEQIDKGIDRIARFLSELR
ncbi:MAG: pyridoxal phosphate-dependent aminotransferase [Phycisphaerae bacterium]|nr:pyridoxal phosphate-dependent aminotransferase [Phycisphaerae bacterium]MDW8261058.1 pyridoxal phosphate-dependent aminotransferase [Phycisphaerales bacterium]